MTICSFPIRLIYYPSVLVVKNANTIDLLLKEVFCSRKPNIYLYYTS